MATWVPPPRTPRNRRVSALSVFVSKLGTTGVTPNFFTSSPHCMMSGMDGADTTMRNGWPFEAILAPGRADERGEGLPRTGRHRDHAGLGSVPSLPILHGLALMSKGPCRPLQAGGDAQPALETPYRVSSGGLAQRRRFRVPPCRSRRVAAAVRVLS